MIILDMDRRIASELQSSLKERMERVFKPMRIGGKVKFEGAADGATFLHAGDTARIERADEYMYIAKNTGDRLPSVFRPNSLRRHLIKARPEKFEAGD